MYLQSKHSLWLVSTRRCDVFSECHYYSLLFIDALAQLEFKGTAEMCIIKMKVNAESKDFEKEANHEFVVVNRKKGSDLSDPGTWGATKSMSLKTLHNAALMVNGNKNIWAN